MRHPTLLKFVDGVETEKEIYIATEPVQPLSAIPKDSLIIQWGLWSLINAIKFINTDCGLVHGNITRSSVYVTASGEWKLAGWELCCSLQEDNPIFIASALKWVDDKYLPPEVRKASWSIVKSNPPFVVDSWTFGTLIYEIFNGILPRQDGFSNGSIPPQLLGTFQRLVADDPRQRPSMPLLETNPYFDHPIVYTVKFLDQISLKEKPEKEEFIKHLLANVDQLPPAFRLHKVLPEIANALEFGGIGPPALNLIMKMGKALPPPEYEKHIVPIIVRAFAMPDRSIRVTLCNALTDFVELLPENVVNEKIWSHFAAGFMDIHALVREATLRAILALLPKLSSKILNNDVVNYLGKLQSDEEAGIRTNAVICLGKLVPNLSASTLKKFLIPGLSRALKDPFPPARHAGLLALTASSSHITSPDLATQIIPAIGPLLIDPDKKTRMNAIKTINIFIKKLTEEAESMVQQVADGGAGTNGAVPAGVPMNHSASLPGGLPSTQPTSYSSKNPPPPSTNPLVPAVIPSYSNSVNNSANNNSNNSFGGFNGNGSSELTGSFGAYGTTVASNPISSFGRSNSSSALKTSNSGGFMPALPPPPPAPATNFGGTNGVGGMSLPSKGKNGWDDFDDFENSVIGNNPAQSRNPLQPKPATVAKKPSPKSTRTSQSQQPPQQNLFTGLPPPPAGPTTSIMQNSMAYGTSMSTTPVKPAVLPSAWDDSSWDDKF
ncbi:hypothetical protein SmJEL517_g06091 [Synchytrium microbalum]|uniref:Protein kinase domain-containing protein n=1 Tax=Synchytrium microbalum TaxID=1806994 RepID=A0A507BX68_9FUNG|nr:uncharacterized protein SmJEL517_g06091 [Synchytrium microbalum]TPX30326.1 hypothetical protein SmJEL517_g06091 [Synchytrium microbalum]